MSLLWTCILIILAIILALLVGLWAGLTLAGYILGKSLLPHELQLVHRRLKSRKQKR
jgi:hypothetical protein